MDKKPLSETMTVTAWFDDVVIPLVKEVRDCDGGPGHWSTRNEISRIYQR